ncbi:hypothetical protein LCGC14_0494730 [marine sediment metagenome]|uniref:Calcineurin-like phosphoesterase domain-containing protein n=1 Tax=marine sediment metagenome TaxID=412755 RepID=A0A0F9SP17_9ZZZZ|nr:hypothetical protein [Phycisphaerae bacterium]HDZ43496.1 hypothetical protein [Phycisphaerae bacterium]
MRAITRREFLATGATALAVGAVGSMLVGCEEVPGPDHTDAEGSPVLRFAHITDSHMDLGRPTTVTWLERFVTAINEDFKDIDFVLVGGDNFNNNVPGDTDAVRFKTIMDELRCPAYSVRGNKESSPKPYGDPIDQRQFAEMFFPPDVTVHGRDWLIEKGGYLLLGVDTTLKQKDNGRYSDESLAFVEGHLQADPNRQVIVLDHHVYDNFWNSTNEKDIHKYVLNNVEQVKGRLFKYPNLLLLLCGHKHLDDVHQVGATTVAATPGFVVPWGPQANHRRFRHVEIRDGHVSERLVELA